MKLLSFPTIERENNWLLRASVLGNDTILVVMFNERTTETLVRCFINELDANLYIEYICHKHLLKDESNE